LHGRQSLGRAGTARRMTAAVGSQGALQTQYGQRSVGRSGSEHLPAGMWKWLSIEPELYPTCSPWLLSPSNLVVMLGKVIVHGSDWTVQR
jgi:hypothetical protein